MRIIVTCTIHEDVPKKYNKYVITLRGKEKLMPSNNFQFKLEEIKELDNLKNIIDFNELSYVSFMGIIKEDIKVCSQCNQVIE